jgi:hypothetical protein
LNMVSSLNLIIVKIRQGSARVNPGREVLEL